MDISAKIDDSIFIELLNCVSMVAVELDTPFFVVGATARDMILWYGFDIRPGRATKDVDFGFMVSSWEEYDRLKAALTATGVLRLLTSTPLQPGRFASPAHTQRVT